jgi:hypothetical protein
MTVFEESPLCVGRIGCCKDQGSYSPVDRNQEKKPYQTVEHDQSGFIGSITYGGDLAEFLPLLVLGEYVYLGEDAVFGNGWYTVESEKQ